VSEPETVVLLHGFGGTHHAWDGVAALLPRERYRPLALDLPGHGEQADAPRPITFAGCVAHVLARAGAPEHASTHTHEHASTHDHASTHEHASTHTRTQSANTSFTLCGYSLGGRVALHVALAAPERVRRLVLVSTAAGIEDPAERARRLEADGALAAELEDGRYDEFIERWRTQPLFADEPPAVGALARADQRRNRPDALAAVLRGIGAGGMQPLWGRLHELRMPVAVLVGERDAKYRALGQRMARLLPRGELRMVPGGHGLPLENPAAVAATLRLPCPAS